MNIAIYTRVSLDDKEQNPERQLLKCRQYCELNNHKVLLEIEDYAHGDTDVFSRDEFNKINLNKIDGIIVFSIERLTRQHPNKVMNLLNYLKSRGVLVVSITEPIFNMESEFAELMQYFLTWWNNYFLKKLSRDVKSGLERAVAKGKKLGRRPVKVNVFKIKQLREEGKSLREISKELDISLGKVQRVLKECIKNPP